MTSIVLEEYELLGDSKYRAYMSLVDKALKAFEYTTEWADLIAALDKLNKVLLAHMKYPIIPRRIVISKRLQQCMHHALPSGVHLKALGTYDIIFKCMGTNRLAQELFLYSAGLFPLLGNAAMNVRPTLLTVYETHFVPLGERLRPALNGLLSGVLLGLEEGSDHYGRTNSLLQSICEAVHPRVFYSSLWECVASNLSIRLPAITFVLQHFDRKGSNSAAPTANASTSPEPLSEKALKAAGTRAPPPDLTSDLFGDDMEVVVTAICLAMQDSSVLVQRNALDLLLAAFPMHLNVSGVVPSSMPSKRLLSATDRVELMAAAVAVLLRRDMSLNRRLFSWLLGTDSLSSDTNNANGLHRLHHNNKPVSSEDPVRQHARTNSIASVDSMSTDDDGVMYFEHFSRELLAEALRLVLRRSLDSTQQQQQQLDLKPYRILISLLDRPEVGSLVIEDVIMDVFRALYHVHRRLLPDAAGHLQQHLKRGSAVNFQDGGAWSKSWNPGVSSDAGSSKGRQELIKTANLLFGTLDPAFIWEVCGDQFAKAAGQEYRINETDEDVNSVGCCEATVVEVCAVTDFLLDIVSIETYVETQSEHMPILFKRIVSVLTNSSACARLTPKEVTKALFLAKKILSKVQPSWNAWDAREAAATGGVLGTAKKVKSSGVSFNEEIDKEATEHMATSPSSPEDEGADKQSARSCSTKAYELMMADCTATFQRFYVEFLRQRVFASSMPEREPFSAQLHIASLINRFGDNLEERTKHLERLLASAADEGGASGSRDFGGGNLETEESLIDQLRQVQLPLQGGVHLFHDAIWCSCSILIELSSVPTLIDHHRQANGPSSADTLHKSCQPQSHCDCSPEELPSWLQYLVLCSCLLGHDNAEIMLKSADTLLEMVDLLGSNLEVQRHRLKDGDALPASGAAAPGSSDGPSSSSFTIAMLPILKEASYCCIFNQTIFAQVLAAKLWDGLGQMKPVHHPACVSLLHHLHNVVPNPKAVERVVARSLGSSSHSGPSSSESGTGMASSASPPGSVDAFQRFTLFWHLSRDNLGGACYRKASGTSEATSAALYRQPSQLQRIPLAGRTFDICLLKMLDNLSITSGPLKTLSQSWLVHAMSRGDVARIMEPLFLTLLDPSTARVSVFHSRIERVEPNNPGALPDAADEEPRTHHKIYVITAAGGEVIYHVAGSRSFGASGSEDLRQGSKSSGRGIGWTSGANRAMRSFALQSRHSSSNSSINMASTSNGGNHRELHEQPSSNRLLNSAPIAMVNPFALVPPELEEYDSYTKGYNNKFVINDSFELQSSSSGQLATSDGSGSGSESLVNAGEGPGSLASSAENDHLLSGPFSIRLGALTASAATAIHPLHSHILLYTRVPDSRQVLYTMRCIKNIIQTNARLVICSLSTTSLSSASSSSGGLTKPSAATSSSSPSSTPVSRSYQVQILLARHRKSVFGRGFAGDLTPENMATFRNSTLMEVLVTTALYHLRSYYPNIGQAHLGEEEVRSNREVQLMSIDILALLVSELILVVRDNGKAFATYISDLFARCKVQKVVLHSLLAGVNDMSRSHRLRWNRKRRAKGAEARTEGQGSPSVSSNCNNNNSNNLAFTEDILEFNEIQSSRRTGCDSSHQSSKETFTAERISNYSEAFQVQTLRLLLSLVMLEEVAGQQTGGSCNSAAVSAAAAAASPVHTGSAPEVISGSGSTAAAGFVPTTMVSSRRPVSQLSLNVNDKSKRILDPHQQQDPQRQQQQQSYVLRYLGDQRIPDQPMFLAAVLSALRSPKMRHLHPHWTCLVTSCLPFLGHSLSAIVIEVTAQLCNNLERMAPFYDQEQLAPPVVQDPDGDRDDGGEEDFLLVPADYIVTQLEALTVITHHCLLSHSAQALSALPAGCPADALGGGAAAPGAHHPPTAEILSNLLHVFMSNTDIKSIAASSQEGSASMDALMTARRSLFSTLPRLVSCAATLWSAVGGGVVDHDPTLLRSSSTSSSSLSSAAAAAAHLVGRPRSVRSHLLDLLSPIAHHHPTSFLAAISVAWMEEDAEDDRSCAPAKLIRRPLPTCNAGQEVLVGLVSSIRTLPVSVTIQTVRQVLKNPPSVVSAGNGLRQGSVEVPALQFFYFYLARCSSGQIHDSWSNLALLLRDCLALAPPAVFLALAILNQYVHRSASIQTATAAAGSTILTLDHRKDHRQKELQDLAVKLVEECAKIGGSCLEQTTWLRRNLEVRSELQMTADGEDEDEAKGASKEDNKIEDGFHRDEDETASDNDRPASLKETGEVEAESTRSEESFPDRKTSNSSAVVGNAPQQSVLHLSDKRPVSQYAVPAMALLGELLAPLLDIVYNSDEKEKAMPLLHAVMYNVIPYLRNHSRSNLASFRACSRLLASLSEYQYTRKAWRKDAMELLLDQQFFQVDLPSLQHWRTTVDNLMTHDKTTFKELMTKVSSISQSGSLSLFSSKEQELEQRALLLKRLAFVIFCSEVDQYQKHMPDIQEKLAESLRTIPSSPGVQSAVFLCFRVILVRLSPEHITSLWPLIITEMVQIFSYLEQELSTDTEEWSSHLKRMSTLDSSWVVSAGSNGLAAHNSPAWINLYLSVCKLLDLALALPAQKLPQFQMYRWAFVSEGASVDDLPPTDAGANAKQSVEIPSRSSSSVSSSSSPTGGSGKTTGNGSRVSISATGLYQQQDFVPYVVRVARLLLSKVNKVRPMKLKKGEPQLTMTAICSLEELAPFFAAVCDSVTRQQTKSKTMDDMQREFASRPASAMPGSGWGGSSATASTRSRLDALGSGGGSSSPDVINSILERDFLEQVMKP